MHCRDTAPVNASLIANLRKQIDGPRDGALLRFSLGNALVGAGERVEAIVELRRAVEYDPNYSAAWKLLGRALVDHGDAEAAREAFNRGIEVASARGDEQAAKEMRVFLRRLDRPQG